MPGREYEALRRFDYTPDGRSDSIRVERGETVTSAELNDERADEIITLGVLKEVTP